MQNLGGGTVLPSKGGDNEMEEESSTGEQYVKNPPLQKWVKFVYGTGDFSCSASSAIMAFFLLPFLFEVAGVHPFTAGFILLISRCWDAITDPIVGRLSDLTNTRWGRRRPWLLFGSVPLAVSYFFLWQVIPGSSQIVDLFYYLFWLVLYNTFYTCISVPHLSLIPEMTNSDKERTELTSYKIVTLVLAALIGTAVHGILLGTIENQRLAYFISATIFSFIFIFPPIITAFVCKEIAGMQRVAQKDQPSFIQGMIIAAKNRPFVLLCGSFLGAYMGTQFLVAHFYLYVQYVLREEEHIIALIIILQCAIAVSVVAWQQASRKIEKKLIFYIGTLCCIACAVGLIFVRNIIWLYPGSIVLGVGIGAIFLIPFALVPEIIDRDEKAIGCRREGVYYGLFVFLQKMATSVGLAIGSVSLGIAGLESNEEEQGTAVLIVLRLMTGVFPALLFIFSLFPMFFYPYGKRLKRHSVFSDSDLFEEELSEYQPPEIMLENEDQLVSKSDI